MDASTPLRGLQVAQRPDHWSRGGASRPHSTIEDDLQRELAAEFVEHELLDLYLLCGWYHAISYAANAAADEHEPGTPTFAADRPT